MRWCEEIERNKNKKRNVFTSFTLALKLKKKKNLKCLNYHLVNDLSSYEKQSN